MVLRSPLPFFFVSYYPLRMRTRMPCPFLPPVVQGGRSVVVMTLDPKREKEEDRDKRTHTSRRRSADLTMVIRIKEIARKLFLWQRHKPQHPTAKSKPFIPPRPP